LLVDPHLIRTSPFLVIVYASFPTGKFEDFKALGALLELSIGDCSKIDCKKALEVLPTMPWAAQIQTLDLSKTDIEGTAEYSFVFGAPVRNSSINFFSKNIARNFSSGSQNSEKIPGIFLAQFELSPDLPACQSSSPSHFLVILYASVPTGKFEDFKALGALLELSIGGYGCKIDCKKALEVLPTMPWAAQIQKLDLYNTNVEGTAECSFVFGAPVRFFWKNFLF